MGLARRPVRTALLASALAVAASTTMRAAPAGAITPNVSLTTTLSDADPGALTGSKIQQTSDSRTIPASVAAGSYDLAVAIVDKSNGNVPAVQLGLSNPEYDANGTKITPGGFTAGWYQLGSISVR